MDKSYLAYPKRTYGQDHKFYDWQQAKDRKKLSWDNEAKVAISFIIPVEFSRSIHPAPHSSTPAQWSRPILIYAISLCVSMAIV